MAPVAGCTGPTGHGTEGGSAEILLEMDAIDEAMLERALRTQQRRRTPTAVGLEAAAGEAPAAAGDGAEEN